MALKKSNKERSKEKKVIKELSNKNLSTCKDFLKYMAFVAITVILIGIFVV